MDSFRRLFAQRGDEQTSAAGSRASSAPASTTAATDDDDRMQVDPVSHSRQAQDNDDNMPELLSGSDSSDSENEDGVDRPSSSSSATTSAYAQIQPADATPDRRPRVEDVIDDDDRNRRTPRTATPDPSAQADAAAEAGDRPVRPLPRAFSSTRRIPMAGSYVMQGVSFAIPRQDAAAQEQLVEPVAATPATPAQPPPTAAPQTPPQHNDNAAQDGQANAQEPPPWLSNLLGSIFGALAQSNVRSTPETPDTPASDQGDTQAQPAADGSRGGSMNFLFPDVGVAASATARRAPPGTQPQQPTAQNAPAPPPENGPQHEFTMADLRRLQETAMRALLGGQGANANAAQPGPQTVPVPVPVPVPFPFPFFGGFHDAPSEDPGQARRLIEGLEEVPPGLVKRYMTVEKATDGGTGACAVCFEGLDTDLEDGEGASQWGSNAPQQDGEAGATAPAAPSSPGSARSDGSAPAPAPEEPPLRPRIVVLPCGHAFHSTCLQPWFSQHTTCPNCRYNVDPDGLASSAYIDGHQRTSHGPIPNFTPPPAFFADLLAHLNGAGTPPAPAAAQPSQPNAAQAQPQQARPVTPQPAPGMPHRFTFNLGPFPVGGSPQAQGAPPPVFPWGWPPQVLQNAPQQAGQPQQGQQPSPTPGSGPRIHHQAHHHHIVDGVETIFDTFEIELDIGMTVPVGAGSGNATPEAAATGEAAQTAPPSTAPPPSEQRQRQDRPDMPPPLEMLFHIVAPVDPALHQQQQQQQPQEQQQNAGERTDNRVPPPDATRLPSLHDLFRGPLWGVPPTPAQRRQRQPRRKWSRPEPQGRTLRQYVEKRERELGLRCDSVCCGLAPTDDDPTPQVHGPVKLVRLQNTSGQGGKQCVHEYHPQCIITAARIAAEGAGREAADPSAVACPICRVEGSVDPEVWAEGERALQAEVE